MFDDMVIACAQQLFKLYEREDVPSNVRSQMQLFISNCGLGLRCAAGVTHRVCFITAGLGRRLA